MPIHLGYIDKQKYQQVRVFHSNRTVQQQLGISISARLDYPRSLINKTTAISSTDTNKSIRLDCPRSLTNRTTGNSSNDKNKSIRLDCPRSLTHRTVANSSNDTNKSVRGRGQM
ncbi:hypothetical protein BsWGS_05011 [Bradybaena similaris]